MSGNSEHPQKNKSGVVTEPDSSQPQYTNDATTSDAEAKKRQQEFDAEARNFFAGIPIVGRIIVLVKLKFGWAGILLSLAGFLAGFLLAVILAYTDRLPKLLVFNADRSTPSPTPSPTPSLQATREYELVSDPKTILAKAMENAQSNMEVSGIALTFIDPQVLKEKILGGFKANIVLLHPCSDAIANRIEAELGNPGARNNVLNQLRRLKTSWEQLPAGKRDLLQVKLSQRPATMIVGMFDRRRHLYAYPCRFGGPCTDSHVLVFKDYGERNPENAVGNKAGNFFEKHYDAVFRDAGQPLDFNMYNPQNYDPCPAPSPEGTL